MNDFSRRKFLQLSGIVSLAPMLPAAARSFATSTTAAPIGKFFVGLRVFGGMDATLGLDPWLDATRPLETDMFVEYQQADLINGGGQIKLGPAAAPLKKHAGSFSIVNGVFMSQADNGHGASGDYIAAGSSQPTAPYLPVEIARSTVEGDFGVINNSGLKLGDRSLALTAINDLKDLPNKTDFSAILSLILNPASKTTFADAVRKIIDSGAATKNFIKNLLAMNPDPEQLSDYQILAAVFMSDMASAAHLEPRLRGILDTHASHAGNHLTAQTQAWTEIATLFDVFKATPYGKGSLFDHTTFMITTEFSRTPALNGAGGKDHNPLTNSVLLAGRGIKGGLVVGGSRLVTAAESPTGSSYHIAYPIDYSTFEVQRNRTPQAQMIFPENVAQTVATIMDVDRNIFSSVPAKTKALSVLIQM